MGDAKNIRVAPISVQDARMIIKKFHYSGKFTAASQLNLGVFLDDRLHGAMQFGPPLDKRKSIGLVKDTKWNGFLELNRMAFGPELPKNSESRALGVAMRLIKKTYPHIEWILSFSDATQCGDGTIYRAAGFVLTGIKTNKTIIKLKDGTITTDISLRVGKWTLKNGGASSPLDGKVLPGFQIRYVYFLSQEARKRLTVAEIPYSRLEEVGAKMYLGKPAIAWEAK